MELDTTDADLDAALEGLIAFEVRRRIESVHHLREALSSNRDIGVATGLLMGRLGLSRDDAFAALVRTSRDSNRKLRLVALDVILHRGLVS